MGVISKYFSLCKNFHSKAGMGVNSDMGVISREYGIVITSVCLLIIMNLATIKGQYGAYDDNRPTRGRALQLIGRVLRVDVV